MIYILQKLFIFGFTLEGAAIYTYYKIYVFILQEKTFCCCYSCNSVKVPGSPGISLKVLEKSWNFDAKGPGKSEKKSWKVLEFESIFFGGNHVYT